MLDKVNLRIVVLVRQKEVEKALGKFQKASEGSGICIRVSKSEALEHLFLFLAHSRVLASYL